MKRDLDLARRILREMEEADFDGGSVAIELPNVPPRVLQYHLLLLSEAGLIDVLDASTTEGPDYMPLRLTWKGHEFLDASRSDNLWSKAKAVVFDKTGGMPFDILLTLLREYAKQAVFGTDAV